MKRTAVSPSPRAVFTRAALLASLVFGGTAVSLAEEFTQWVEDAFPTYEVVLDTLNGPVTCTLVEVEKDMPELRECRGDDDRLLTPEEIEDLGLAS